MPARLSRSRLATGLVPAACFLAALALTVAVGADGSSPAAKAPGARASVPAPVHARTGVPPRAALASVPALPVPLERPRPTRPAMPAQAPAVVAVPTPAATAAPKPVRTAEPAPPAPVTPPPAAAPAPAPAPAPPPPPPAPAPSFDDSGSGPGFDGTGASP